MRLLLFALLTAAFSFCDAADKPLIVGMELAYPPFEMRDASGQPSGVSVDIAKELAAYLKRPVEIQNLPFDGLIPALKTGRIDLIISSMTATPERSQSIDFSQPYLTTGLCLLVGAKSNIQGVQDADQAGYTVAVKKGTTGHLYAKEHLQKAKLLVLDRENACVLEVAQGKANAFIFDQMSTLKSWQKNAETTRAILAPFQKESWAIGVRKGNSELLNSVNAFLEDAKKRKFFDTLSERWLPSEKAEFQKLGLPFYF